MSGQPLSKATPSPAAQFHAAQLRLIQQLHASDRRNAVASTPLHAGHSGSFLRFQDQRPLCLSSAYCRTIRVRSTVQKVKVAHTRLPSVGCRSWSRFLAVSLQVTWVINLAVGCHYFPPGLQSPSQPLSELLLISLLGDRGTMGVNSLPKTVTRQRRGCDLYPGPTAPESSTQTTRLPSHPVQQWRRTFTQEQF